jgi:aquaporin NIP
MKRYIAEALATFTLMFLGTGAATVNEISPGIVTHLGIAASFGIVVLAMIYTYGDESGAHMNPAVTIAFAVQKVFPLNQVLPYIISQLIGAISASAVLHLLFPNSVHLGGTLPAGSEVQSFVLEFILTFLLMMTILHVAQKGKEKGLFAGLAIAAIVFLEALFAGPISGASMNPTRSLAPALVSGQLQHLWIYLAAPIAGAISAVLIYQFIKQS